MLIGFRHNYSPATTSLYRRELRTANSGQGVGSLYLPGDRGQVFLINHDDDGELADALDALKPYIKHMEVLDPGFYTEIWISLANEEWVPLTDFLTRRPGPVVKFQPEETEPVLIA